MEPEVASEFKAGARKRRRKWARSRTRPRRRPNDDKSKTTKMEPDDNHELEREAHQKRSPQMGPASPLASSRPAGKRKFWPLALAALQLLLALNAGLELGASASTLQDFDGATFYKAPVGSRVRIACNASNWWDDSISLVLWFKGSKGSSANTQPIYTIDARQRPLSSGQARHLVSDAYKGRARFVLPAGSKWPSTGSNQSASGAVSATATATATTTTSQPYLDLAPLTAADQGEYRCRVDYRQRPRENFLIILFVLVPPSSVEIMDATGRPLEQIYGPLNEGAELTLLCLAKGGRPAPLITWRRNGRVIDESYLTLNDFLTLRLASQRKQLAPLQSSNSSDLSSSWNSAGSQATSSGDKNRNVDNNRTWPNRRRRSAQSSQLLVAEAGALKAARADSINLGARRALGADRKFSGADQRKGYDDDDDDDVAHTNPSQSERRTVRWATGASVASVASVASGPPAGQQPEVAGIADAHSAAEWLAWPEFAYFQLGHDEFFYRQSNKLAVSGNEGAATATRSRANSAPKWRPKLAGSGFGLGAAGNGSSASSSAPLAQPQPLIEAQVAETVTTAVNVLHLAELSRGQLVQLVSELPAQQQDRLELDSFQQAAKLECHASNLHYDLRALIKMFAPPSLQASGNSSTSLGSEPRTTTTMNLEGAQEDSVLAASIEAALWANLASLNYVAPSDEESATAPAAVPQRLAAGDNSLQKGAQEQAPSGEQTNWPALIQQQLIRPHLLGSSGAVAPAPAMTSQAANEPAKTQPGQRAPGQPAGGELARNKLIALEAFLRPLDVKVSPPQRPLVAGQVSEFICSSSGSRPAARLSWFKNGLPIGNETGSAAAQVINVVQSTNSAGSAPLNPISQSRLSLKLLHEHHQAQLSCRAENVAHLRAGSPPPSARQQLKDSETVSLTGSEKGASPASLADSWALEDSVTLDVHYTPRVKLELGNRMLREQIREGQDIFFSCLVDAQPAVYEITWLHNERPINETSRKHSSLLADGPEQQQQQLLLQSGASPTASSHQKVANAAGAAAAAAQAQLQQTNGPNGQQTTSRMIVSNNSLVLQRVQIDQRGRYACMATNSEGVGLSNPIDLRVLHAPICVQPARAADDRKQTSHLLADELEEEEASPSSTTTNRRQLHLGRRALAAEARSKFKCHMLAEPANSLEFTWYLNNSFNERRLLLTSGQLERAHDDDRANLIDVAQAVDKSSSGGNSSQAGSVSAPPATSVAQQRRQVASSQLLFEVQSELDYGELYCVARNAIGEQQRACVYTIEPAARGDFGSAPPEQRLACLALNVTSQSAWIGCDDGAGAGSRPASQLDENNEPARPNAARRHKFNVRVFSLEPSAASPASSRPASEPKRTLEAKLTSDQLSEPWFALANLRPSTSYLLEVEPLDSFDGRPLAGGAAQPATVVRLSTPAAGDELPAGGSRSAPRESVEPPGVLLPSIRQVSEPHQADLLAAALISTRSTSASNSHLHHGTRQRASASGRLLQARAEQPAGDWWDSLTSFLASWLFPADQAPLAASRRQVHPNSNERASRPAYLIKWLQGDGGGGAPLALLLCAALLAITLTGFIVLRRLWAASSGDGERLSRRRRSSGSGTSAQCKQRAFDGQLNDKSKRSPSSNSDDEDHSDQFELKMSCLSGAVLPAAADRKSAHFERQPNGTGEHLAGASSSEHLNRCNSVTSSICAGGGATRTRQNQHQLDAARGYATLASRPARQQQQPPSINFLQPSVLGARQRAGPLASHAARNQTDQPACERPDANQHQASRSRSSSCLAGVEASLELGGQPATRPRASKSRLIQSSELGPSRNVLQQQGLISDADFFLKHSNSEQGAASGNANQLQMLREQNTLIGGHANNAACLAAASNQQQWHLLAGQEQVLAAAAAAGPSPMSSLESPFGPLAGCSCTDNNTSSSLASTADTGRLALVLPQAYDNSQLVPPMIGNEAEVWSQLEQGQQVGVVEIMAMLQPAPNKMDHIGVQLVDQRQARVHHANTNQSSSFNSSSFGTPPHSTIKDSLISPPLSFATNTTLSNGTDSYQASNNIILTPTDREYDASTTLILNGRHSSEESSNSTRAHRSILRNSASRKSALSPEQRHERDTRNQTPVCHCDNSNPNAYDDSLTNL